jgi:hypothetical protein
MRIFPLKTGRVPRGLYGYIIFANIAHAHNQFSQRSTSEMGGHAVSFNHLNADAHRGAAQVSVYFQLAIFGLVTLALILISHSSEPTIDC